MNDPASRPLMPDFILTLNPPPKISVGFGGGDIPIFPPLFMVLCVVLGVILRYTIGKRRFLPSLMRPLYVRVPIFAACVAAFAQVPSEPSSQNPPHTGRGAHLR